MLEVAGRTHSRRVPASERREATVERRLWASHMPARHTPIRATNPLRLRPPPPGHALEPTACPRDLRSRRNEIRLIAVLNAVNELSVVVPGSVKREVGLSPGQLLARLPDF